MTKKTASGFAPLPGKLPKVRKKNLWFASLCVMLHKVTEASVATLTVLRFYE
jgi:hypothetical protein